MGLGKLKGLKKASEDFMDFELLGFKPSPIFSHSLLLFVKFEDGDLGLATYSEKSQTFKDDPDNLKAWGLTEKELYKKHPEFKRKNK